LPTLTVTTISEFCIVLYRIGHWVAPGFCAADLLVDYATRPRETCPDSCLVTMFVEYRVEDIRFDLCCCYYEVREGSAGLIISETFGFTVIYTSYFGSAWIIGSDMGCLLELMALLACFTEALRPKAVPA
jgi:hypothetical protein